jgi:hypothetical protein
MKKILLLNMLMLFISIGINAQTVLNNHKGLQLSVRGGFDVMPNYQNNTPSIDYKGNWMAGATANYYFNRWLGMGIDSDFLVNNPQSKYPTSNLFRICNKYAKSSRKSYHSNFCRYWTQF